ncbi:hypothetical protein QGM71_04055 [Virgibacillus sp. C22-A2]|uniref:RNA polymerase subunit sigma n=1 Tax=Virgibacillus tibetensis TaxID=3042313 RepID=A0ABU6KBG6_9BACI|nr:hypothetical protein [Virgibacillus sp. C22-A2]
MILLSWKSIEMQVALPRTQDAGKLQEQMLKQSQHFQESLAGSQLKQEELRRKRVNEFENINEAKNNKEELNQHEMHGHESDQKKDTANHPYLGKKIDFNG